MPLKVTPEKQKQPTVPAPRVCFDHVPNTTTPNFPGVGPHLSLTCYSCNPSGLHLLFPGRGHHPGLLRDWPYLKLVKSYHHAGDEEPAKLTNVESNSTP